MRALARSERAAARVRELGAEPVMGDLDNVEIQDCEIAFHAAAHCSADGGSCANAAPVNATKAAAAMQNFCSMIPRPVVIG